MLILSETEENQKKQQQKKKPKKNIDLKVFHLRAVQELTLADDHG